MSAYTLIIADTLEIGESRARLVEGFLRLQYRTLDTLSREDIEREYRSISIAIDADPNAARALAHSYGLYPGVAP